MKNSLIILLLIMVSTFPIHAQRRNYNYNVNKALPWVTGRLPNNSDKVRYKVAYGEGTTYQQAREDATVALISELGWEHNITVTSKTIDEVKHVINNDNSNFSQNRSSTTIIEQDGYTASITKVDEYSEIYKNSSREIKYKVWQLYAIDCPWASQINLKYSTQYGFASAGWRSLVIPGWGQFYKKQYVKGIAFLSLEVASIATLVYFQNRCNYNLKRSLETPILDLQIEFSNRAHQQQIYRNVSIGVCAAVWALNILDAALLEGRPRYIDSDLDLAFSTTRNNEPLLSLTYKF